jgi:hypothetical protein
LCSGLRLRRKRICALLHFALANQSATSNGKANKNDYTQRSHLALPGASSARRAKIEAAPEASNTIFEIQSTRLRVAAPLLVSPGGLNKLRPREPIKRLTHMRRHQQPINGHIVSQFLVHLFRGDVEGTKRNKVLRSDTLLRNTIGQSIDVRSRARFRQHGAHGARHTAASARRRDRRGGRMAAALASIAFHLLPSRATSR